MRALGERARRASATMMETSNESVSVDRRAHLRSKAEGARLVAGYIHEALLQLTPDEAEAVRERVQDVIGEHAFTPAGVSAEVVEVERVRAALRWET